MSLSINLEIEFKNMLTKDEYTRLLNTFNPNQIPLIVQQNIYYDTKNLTLKQLKSALRIRVKDETYELTLKLHQPIGLLEVNQMLSKEEVATFNNDHILPTGVVTDALASHDILVSDLRVITDLTTKRFECPHHQNLLVLDESFYHHQHDYELEYEVTDHESGRRAFEALLQQYDIPTRPADSKVKRAMNAASSN